MEKPLVMITGASSGIGAGTAKLFSQAGYNLALLSRNVDEMKSLDLPNAICISTDVADFNSVNNAVKEVEDIAKSLLWIYEQPQNVCIRDFVIAPTRYEA